MSLPVVDPWYRATRLDARIFAIAEQHVQPVFSANMHLVLGRDGDLLIDSGMGVAPLRPVVDALRPDPDKPLTLLTTHAHVDHVGAAHEFETRLVHAFEADVLAEPAEWSLRSDALSDETRAMLARAGYPPIGPPDWPLLIDALPAPGYDPEAWRLLAAPTTGLVGEGDVIDLGDWRGRILHLPGHAPGQVGVFDEAGGALFSADAVYDGPLVWEGAGCNLEDYAATLRRLRDLPVRVVHGGHDGPFARPRLLEMIERYLRLWGA